MLGSASVLTVHPVGHRTLMQRGGEEIGGFIFVEKLSLKLGT